MNRWSLLISYEALIYQYLFDFYHPIYFYFTFVLHKFKMILITYVRQNFFEG